LYYYPFNFFVCRDDLGWSQKDNGTRMTRIELINTDLIHW